MTGLVSALHLLHDMAETWMRAAGAHE